MRKNMRWLVAAQLMSAAGALLLAGGCEVESASNRIRISPESVTLRKDEVCMFTAEGGYVYTWSLENEQWGTLSSRHGNPVYYTCTYVPSNEPYSIQTIYVVSTYRDTTDYDDATTNSTGTNNPSVYQDQAEAYIVHKYDIDETATTETADSVHQDPAAPNVVSNP